MLYFYYYQSITCLYRYMCNANYNSKDIEMIKKSRTVQGFFGVFFLEIKTNHECLQ